jgi:hypothetical protein
MILHKIIFGCVHGRALIGLRHKCRFALRFFDVSRQEFIKDNPEYVVRDGSTGKLKLKASLSKCGRTSVENEVEYIRQNVPGIFANEEE